MELKRKLLYNKEKNCYLNLKYGDETKEYAEFAKDKNAYEVYVSPEVYAHLKHKSDYTKDLTVTTPKVCLKKIKLPLASLIVENNYKHLFMEYDPIFQSNMGKTKVIAEDDENLDVTGLYISASENIIPIVSNANLCDRTYDYVSGVSDNATQVLEYLQESLDTYNLGNSLDKSKFNTGLEVTRCMNQYKQAKFIIMFTYIENFHNKNMTTGGWRWSRHGDYIGIYKPKYEYLDYENIDYVLVWKLIPVTLK